VQVINRLESAYGSKMAGTPWTPQRLGIPTPSTQAGIISDLTSAGSGSRGLVFVETGTNAQGGPTGHVFNARNVNGQIQLWDAQSNTPGSFAGAQEVYFYRTK
jgi:hypothetical protein